jgi:hypothetical protein
MSTLTIPPPEQIVDRIKICREEMAALRKLLRLSKAAAEAEMARRHREAQPGKVVANG